jgi:hypothetical protein
VDELSRTLGRGGAWPVSSDRTTWVLAAWEIYKVTGDEEWLNTSFDIIRNTLEDDFRTIRSSLTGMYKGESSFLDWREQTYPKWMSNIDIYESENLGTNAVHYQAHMILAKMAKLLNKPSQTYMDRAEKIKKGINKYLWMKEKGYYGQYLYGRTSLTISKRFETLGEALAILFNVADEEQAKSIIENAPLTSFGASCIYPQIPGIPPYHNNGIWPFVQSYWNLAAAKVGNEDVLNHGLASIYRAGALFLTNYENFVAENGDYVGTEINSHRMLWSMAGNLAMVHRVFIGMSFETGGVRFQPVIPSNYSGKKRLSNFVYRNSILDIEVEGYGDEIKSITLDGETLIDAFLPATIEGAHKIVIKMANNRMKSDKLNLVKNRFSLQNPQITLQGDKIVWDTISQALSYNIYRNGKLFESTNTTYFQIKKSRFSEYAVSAVDRYGDESFLSEPIALSANNEIILQIENYYPKANLPYTNFTGEGFIEIRTLINNKIGFKVDISEPGNYVLDCRYSNGSGPWNTDNNCGIRSLYANGKYFGVLVFPQRGENEWSDWGWTNSLKINLKEGKNELKIVFEEWNNNMDGEINDAMIDCIRLIKI